MENRSRPNFTLPPNAVAKVEELRKIVEEYPQTIPVPVLADFLGISPDCLRTSIEQKCFKWGVFWQSPNRASGGRYPGRKTYKILSVPFWMEYTNNAGYMREKSP